MPLLIVEDDTALAELIATYLGRQGYAVTVIGRGDEALAAVQRLRPQLVVLDVMLPGLDGLQVCRQLRAIQPSLPILMLTALDDSHDQVLGLEIGADDYVSKPCEPRVLLARIRTLLRRCQLVEAPADDRLTIGHLQLLPGERQVWWRDQLIQQLRGIEFNGVDRSVDVAISKLRRRFEEHPGEARRIKTVWGKGYLLSRAEWE
nr:MULTISPECIES: response regulator transcription factor [unclassified Pseudomonas]